VRSAATEVSREHGLPILLADEGGLSPGCETGRVALELMVESIERAGLIPGEDISIAIDVAATALKATDGRYRLAREGRDLSSEAMIRMIEGSAPRCNWLATTSSRRTRGASRAASMKALATACWSRRTRTARLPVRST
jgi:enolase